MKRRGGILVEVIVSILVFLVGLLALISSLVFGLRAVMDSAIALGLDQQPVNKIEEDLLGIIIEGETPTQHSGTTSSVQISIGGGNINCTLYHYQRMDGKGPTFYILKRNP